MHNTVILAIFVGRVNGDRFEIVVVHMKNAEEKPFLKCKRTLNQSEWFLKGYSTQKGKSFTHPLAVLVV